MLTIFATPRPFKGPIDIIQRNAIKSWLLLEPKCQIILFEDEKGTTCKVAKELGVQCVADIKCDDFSTLLLSDVFNRVRKMAANEIIAHVNADIILMNDFLRAIAKIKEITKGGNFYMSSQRWNLNIEKSIQFDEEGWEKRLRQRIAKEGELHTLCAMDCWVFPRDFKLNPPPFIVGRAGMDSWLIYKARSLKIPVIDVTEVATILHQDHNYPERRNPLYESELKKNLKLAGGLTRVMTLRDADWILTPKGLKKPRFPRRIFSELSLFYPWRLMLSAKRKLQRLGK